jgi:hypothetical protein
MPTGGAGRRRLVSSIDGDGQDLRGRVLDHVDLLVDHPHGTKVTVSGSGLVGATPVKLGSVAATSFSVNAKGTEITLTAPAHSAGVVDVTVTPPAGTSPATNADLYTFD